MKKTRVIKVKYFAITIFVMVVLLGVLLYFNAKDTSHYVKNEIEEHDFDISYGSEDAPIKVFFFMDYTCVHCRNFLLNTFPKVKKEYIDNGSISFNIKVMTFSNNSNILRAYKTLICLNQYGNFEELNKLLLLETEAIFSKEFDELVEDYTIRNSFFADCLLSGQSEKYLEENMQIFIVNQFSGTPTFIINNRVFKGYKKFCDFSKIIEKELRNL
ncbi:MAG: thioredoxin domain-containing protein [Salinivirgaceae bacterium]|nr:thioredoxin domain-containing protein [Salinivirgaceae bacterium]